MSDPITTEVFNAIEVMREQRAEIERLDKQNAAFSDTICERDAEIGRLKAALREIADLPIDEIGEPSAIARAALEGKP